MNPEFRRNLLLELTVHRLIAMPLILLLIYAAARLGGDAEDVSEAASVVMAGLLVLWGTRLAADAVLGEVRGRTWDAQRMSTIGPFSMGWGKLLGSTVYVWYGAALSAPALLYGWEAGYRDLLRIVMVGLFAQSTALFVSLIVRRLRPERLRFQVTASQLIGIVAAVVWWSILEDPPSGLVGSGDKQWYGLTLTRDAFLLVCSVTFLAWTLFGVYRLLRAELQFRSWPVGWTAFVVFFGVYIGGFGGSRQSYEPGISLLLSLDVISRLLSSYIVVLVLVWLAAFVEPKGFVRLRRWIAARDAEDFRRFLEAIPAWFPGMVVGLALGMVFFIVLSFVPEIGTAYGGLLSMESPRAFAVALFMFLMRDIGEIHLITLDGRKRRAHITALVYLVVLYILFPVLAAAADWEAALPVFVPYSEGNPMVITLPVALQVVVVAVLFGMRWRRVARSTAAA